MTSALLLSIITPCLNRAAFIEKAIESVTQQDYPHVEHLIMDGGSSDGTLDLLSAYPNLRVVSEPDRGVYDALNKGIAASEGDIIGQLNTDDYYSPNIFKMMVDLFEENPNVDAVCGSARVFELDPENREQNIALYGPIGDFDLPSRATTGVPIFNAWFFRRRVFKRIGLYSLDYPIMADRDFLIRCHLGGLKILPVDSTCYNYRSHPGSLSINSNYSISLLTEALQLSKSYLTRKNPDPVIKKQCMEWHDLVSIEASIWYLRNGRISNFFGSIRDAMICNPLWLFIVILQSPTRIIKYFKKFYGSRN